MTKEIELLKQEIKMLQSKLGFLEELEKTKSPVEEAFKRVFWTYPSSYDKSVFWTESDENTWIAFQQGYNASQKDYKVGEYQPSPQTPEQVADGLRDAMRQAKEEGVFDDLMERKTAPPEPTPTVFRQKLFDGIKSVFYDPDYERTHWKQKVNMAVDEVLTHFYDVIPNKKEIVDDFEKGWNSCLTSIDMCMEHTDD